MLKELVLAFFSSKNPSKILKALPRNAFKILLGLGVNTKG
jgi:hypothetical protein